MATPITPFAIGDRSLRFRPWSAMTGVREAGKLIASLGDIALDQIVDDAGLTNMLELLTSGGALGEALARTAIRYVYEHDLAERVGYYLALSEVEIQHGEVWLPLYGDGLDDACETGGVDLVLLLEAAFFVVREGCRPLFARLASSVAGQAKS